MPNIKNILCAPRVNFLAKVLTPGDENWKLLPRFFLNLNNNNKTGIITCNMPISEHCIPHFYKSCFQMWKDLPHDKFPKVSVNTISNYFQPVTQNDDQHLRRFEDVQLNLENSLFIKDTNETWVELNVCKQKEVVNLIVGLISKSKNEEFGETYYNCHIEWDIVYSKEPFILLSQKTMEFYCMYE